MPSDNPFDAVYKQNTGATVNGTPTAPKAAPASGPNPFDAVYGGKQVNNAAPGQVSGDPQHGKLYQAADSILNRTSPQADTGNPTLDKISNAGLSLGDNMLTGPVQGVLKGALSTASGIGSIYNKVTGSNQPFNQDNLSELTVARGAGQTVGKGAEQIGEFATGEGAAGKLAGTAGKIAASGAISGVQSGGDPLQTAIGTALPAIMSQPAVKKAGQLLSKFLGMTSGAGEGAIARAFLRPDSNGLAKVMRGEINADQVVGNLEKATTAYRDQAAATYSSRLANIKTTQIPDWRTKSLRFIQNTDTRVGQEMKNFGITRDPNGELNFRHFNGDASKAKELIDTIDNWGSEGRDLTPAGLDSLKKKIAQYSDEGGPLGALANKLEDQAKQNLNAIIPGYSQMTKEYAQAQDLLRKFKSEFSVSASGGSNQGTISRKIQNLFKQNTDYKETLMNKMNGGNDILDQIAGLHLHDVMPRGLMKTIVGGETLYGMLHSPHLNAAVIPTAAAASPRIIGETARAAGKVAASNLPVRDTIRRGLLSATDTR